MTRVMRISKLCSRNGREMKAFTGEAKTILENNKSKTGISDHSTARFIPSTKMGDGNVKTAASTEYKRRGELDEECQKSFDAIQEDPEPSVAELATRLGMSKEKVK